MVVAESTNPVLDLDSLLKHERFTKCMQRKFMSLVTASLFTIQSWTVMHLLTRVNWPNLRWLLLLSSYGKHNLFVVTNFTVSCPVQNEITLQFEILLTDFLIKTMCVCERGR